MERRLAGLCDPGSEDFHEHEMSFSLRTGVNMSPDVSIKIRRRFKPDIVFHNQWLFRYIGVPEPDAKCPVIVRKVINSICYSQDCMTFAKTLGLRMDYEYMAKGKLWTKGNIKIATNILSRTERPGQYDPASIKPVSDSVLVEISCALPESAEYTMAAKQIRDFADQLMPLVCMEKVDYWRKYCSTGTVASQLGPIPVPPM
ncbi:unnamed protein product [Caenorhabditis angaria]|uniref:Mediator of RNA polymerase II transcription subunit 18 n=1 Tax=Caenorhabditis angaria TaxID=860376 RepID=A0A9P1I872_9PELO|nr:unnamed protein product [Caenorhabditis angaria]